MGARPLEARVGAVAASRLVPDADSVGCPVRARSGMPSWQLRCEPFSAAELQLTQPERLESWLRHERVPLAPFVSTTQPVRRVGESMESVVARTNSTEQKRKVSCMHPRQHLHSRKTRHAPSQDASCARTMPGAPLRRSETRPRRRVRVARGSTTLEGCPGVGQGESSRSAARTTAGTAGNADASASGADERERQVQNVEQDVGGAPHEGALASTRRVYVAEGDARAGGGAAYCPPMCAFAAHRPPPSHLCVHLRPRGVLQEAVDGACTVRRGGCRSDVARSRRAARAKRGRARSPCARSVAGADVRRGCSERTRLNVGLCATASASSTRSGVDSPVKCCAEAEERVGARKTETWLCAGRLASG